MPLAALEERRLPVLRGGELDAVGRGGVRQDRVRRLGGEVGDGEGERRGLDRVGLAVQVLQRQGGDPVLPARLSARGFGWGPGKGGLG